MRLIQFVLLLCLMPMATMAYAGGKANKLEQAQSAWAGAIRWGEFEGALNMIDPEVRKTLDITELQLERYRQVQISSYRDVGSSADIKAGRAARDIEIGVINRYTMAERTVRYRETWRWDPQAKAWWITTSLPDLWDGM